MTNPQDKNPISISKILEKIPNRFLLAVAVSRRARQIKDSIQQSGILETNPIVPVLEALRDIMNGDVVVSTAASIEPSPAVRAAYLKEANAAASVGEGTVLEKKNKEAKPKNKSKSLAA